MQTAGEPGSLQAGGTTANLYDAFAPSIFKKEDGEKTFKTFSHFRVVWKGVLSLVNKSELKSVPARGTMQRNVPVVDPCGRSVCCRSTHGNRSLFQHCDDGWKNNSSVLCHRQTPPLGTEMIPNLPKVYQSKMQKRNGGF